MKKIAILLTLSFLFGIEIFGQEIGSEKVPGQVKVAFNKQFPAAKMVKYELNNADYVISFLEKGKQFIFTYDRSGNLLSTDREITPEGLPKEVSSTVSKNFPGYTIITVVKREAPDKGICFEMDLKKEGEGYTVRFGDHGEILMKVARKVEFKVNTKSKK